MDPDTFIEPGYLFNNENATNVAYLEPNVGFDLVYMQGFVEGASYLSEVLVNGKAPSDTTIYAGLFLYRHALELGFKSMLRAYHYVNENNDDGSFWGHNLLKLWEQLRPLMEEDDTSRSHSDSGEYFTASWIEYIDSCVLQIDYVDPTGESIRYHEDHKGNPTLAKIAHVDLDVFADMCTRLDRWLPAVTDVMHETENFYRHHRGYFKR